MGREKEIWLGRLWVINDLLSISSLRIFKTTNDKNILVLPWLCFAFNKFFEDI